MVRTDPLLSAAVSTGKPFYEEFPPSCDLAPFVACTWVRVVRHTDGDTPQMILPDGCADIMVYDDLPPRVAGPDAVTRRERLRDGLVITGIRLRPGACRAVLGCSTERLVNGSVLLSDVATGTAGLHRRLLLSAALGTRFALLEGWVRNAIDRATANDRAAIAACRLLGARPLLDVGDVAREVGWNARMIHRQFIAACGYGPKHFQRIMRIQGVLRAAHSLPVAGLADLAGVAGYADQAHMTRDFRDIIGLTPGAYFASAASPGLGAWINEDW